MKSRKYGTPEDYSDERNCSLCSLNDVCKDSRKSRKYACSLWIDADTRGHDPGSRDFIDMMRKLVKSESVFADTYAIDDRDVPSAKNFYEWCCGEKFLASSPSPYPWQLESGLRLFGDICPGRKCSDPDWVKEIPYNCDVHEIPERLSLRDHGICPKCKKTRLQYINAGREQDYNSMVGVLGQRSGKCIEGSALVHTSRGLIPISKIIRGDVVHIGRDTHIVIAKKSTANKPTVVLKTASGFDIRLTSDHRLMTPKGWREAQNAKEVAIYASDIPWPETSDYTMVVGDGRNVAERLSRLSRDVCIAEVRKLVVSESLSHHLCVLKFASDVIARNVQQFLLSKRIIAKRKGVNLILDNPWSKRYSETFGFANPRLTYVADNSPKDVDAPLSPGACTSLYRLMELQELDRWSLPGPMQVCAEVRNAAATGHMTREDAQVGAIAWSNVSVTSDGLLRAFLVSQLTSEARCETLWDSVVDVEKAPRATVYDIEVEGARRFVANGILAHNSVGIGFIMSNHTHMLLKLKNPSAFYGIKEGTVLHSNVIGTTFGGAKQNVFDPFMATVQDAPWFKLYHEVLADAARKHGEDELFRMNDLSLTYKSAALRIAPSSPSRRNLRGSTRVFAVIDELGHFSEDTKRVNISGMEVYRALTRSLSTVRPAVRRLRQRGVVNVPQGIMATISSPYEVSDPQMQLYNSASRVAGMYAMLRPTWEANPEIKFEDLATEFALDPVSSWRDYGCRPPYSASAFVIGLEPFRNCIQRQRNAVIQTTRKVSPINAGKSAAITATLKFRWSDDVVPKIMTIDAGHVKNSFAVCVAHVDSEGLLVYDAFVEIRPRNQKPVSHRRIFKDVILPLVQKMNVRVAVSDRWQHIATQELLESEGVVFEPVQLRYTDFTAWRDDLIQGRLRIPRPECSTQDILNITGSEESAFDDMPVALFVRQCIRVVDVPGRTVEKPTTGNDDVFRTGVLAHAAVQRPEIVQLLSVGEVSRRNTGALAVAIGASSSSQTNIETVPGVGVAVTSRSR